MKKKLLLCLITITLCLTPLYMVYAEDCAMVSPFVRIIQGKNDSHVNITVFYSDGTTDEHARMRIQTINGNYALCLLLGGSSSRYFEFKPYRLTESPIAYSNTALATFQKAYQYLATNPIGNVELAYVVAQVAVWLVLENHEATALLDGTLQKTVTSAYCSIFSNTYYNLGCGVADGQPEKGYKLTELSYGDKISEAVNAYKSFSYDSTKLGELGIYISETQPGIQPLLSKYECTGGPGDPPPGGNPPDECSYEYDDNPRFTPTDCSSGVSSGYVSDIGDWRCIFKSENAASADIKTRYKEDDAVYCKVFCREDINSNLPSGIISVSQGRYLTVGVTTDINTNISPIVYEGVKTCRVTSGKEEKMGVIDYAQFEADLSTANNKLEEAWNAARAAYLDYTAVDPSYRVFPYADDDEDTETCKTYRVATSEEKTSCENKAKKAVSDEKARRRRAKEPAMNSAEEQQLHKSTYEDCVDDIEDECITYYKNEGYRGCLKYMPAVADDPTTPLVNEYKPAYCAQYSDTAKFTVYEGAENKSEKIKEKIQEIKDKYNGSDGAKGKYDSAKSTIDNLKSSIISCVDKAEGISYNDFEPILEFKYDEPTYGNKSSTAFKLTGSSTTLPSQITYYSGGNAYDDDAESTPIGKEEVKKTTTEKTCSDPSDGRGCRDINFSYNAPTWWEVVNVKQYIYQLEPDIYRYVQKGTGQSVQYNTYQSTKDSIEYVDMGFSNLPIHYSTPKGSYEYQVITTTLGKDDSGGRNKFDSVVGISDGNPSIYTCYYNVNADTLPPCIPGEPDCPIITPPPDCPTPPCPPDDPDDPYDPPPGILGIIYRTISLYSKTAAFPGTNGTGRLPGSNWNNDTLINDYIVNNRGVTGYSIYTDLEPLYEITLTPALMRKIREYNDQQNKERLTIYSDTSSATTGIAGYADFANMTCDANGYNCKSSLLRGWVANFTNIKVTGCAVSGTGYLNCGRGNVAW